MEWAKNSTPLDGLFPISVPADPNDPGGTPDDRHAILTANGRRRIYGALCITARAAGRKTPARLRVLAGFKQRLGLSEQDAAIQESLADHVKFIRMGVRQREKELTIVALVELVTVDGRTTSRERELLCRVAARVGCTPAQVDAFIAAGLARHAPQRAVASQGYGHSDLAELDELPRGSQRLASARSSARRQLGPRFEESDSGLLFDETLLPGRPAAGLFDASLSLPAMAPAEATLLPPPPPRRAPEPAAEATQLANDRFDVHLAHSDHDLDDDLEQLDDDDDEDSDTGFVLEDDDDFETRAARAAIKASLRLVVEDGGYSTSLDDD